jgi:hypothetical protein
MKKTALFFLIIITLFACKKKPDNNVIHINGALKAAFNFQPGTYWIYKDSLTGIMDSFFVTKNTYFTTTNYPYTIESIGINISEYDYHITSLIDTQWWSFSYQSNMFDLRYQENKVFAGEIDYFPLINYPFSDTLSTCAGCIVRGQYGQNNVISIFNFFVVNGQTFENVVEVFHTVNLAPFENYGQYNASDLFYICPNIGIIKMSLNHPQDSINRVWELQRYSIK